MSTEDKSFVPLCMSAEELEAWRFWNQRTVGKYRARRPCSDCPIAFANAMRDRGLCNGAVRQFEPKSSPERLAQWRASTARRRERAATGAPRLRRSTAEVRVLAMEVHASVRVGGAVPAIAKRLGIDVTYARQLLADPRWREAAA